MIPDDYHFMGLALEYARNAAALGEVPVGAVLTTCGGIILAGGGNDCISACDPTGHAEIRVLRQAGQRLRNYRFPGSVLYVTLEPCAMCATAMVHARIERVVTGADDPKTGAIHSCYAIGSDGRLNHTFHVQTGVRRAECSQLLKDFFKQRR